MARARTTFEISNAPALRPMSKLWSVAHSGSHPPFVSRPSLQVVKDLTFVGCLERFEWDPSEGGRVVVTEEHVAKARRVRATALAEENRLAVEAAKAAQKEAEDAHRERASALGRRIIRDGGGRDGGGEARDGGGEVRDERPPLSRGTVREMERRAMMQRAQLQDKEERRLDVVRQGAPAVSALEDTFAEAWNAAAFCDAVWGDGADAWESIPKHFGPMFDFSRVYWSAEDAAVAELCAAEAMQTLAQCERGDVARALHRSARAAAEPSPSDAVLRADSGIPNRLRAVMVLMRLVAEPGNPLTFDDMHCFLSLRRTITAALSGSLSAESRLLRMALVSARILNASNVACGAVADAVLFLARRTDCVGTSSSAMLRVLHLRLFSCDRPAVWMAECARSGTETAVRQWLSLAVVSQRLGSVSGGAPRGSAPASAAAASASSDSSAVLESEGRHDGAKRARRSDADGDSGAALESEGRHDGAKRARRSDADGAVSTGGAADVDAGGGAGGGGCAGADA